MNDTPRSEPDDTQIPEPPDMEMAPGSGAVGTENQQIDDYTLLELLTDEPATETWRAMQDSVEREVLLEILKPAFSENPAALDGFRALVQARAAVVHQYIAPVYEAQETGGTVYYTRELVRGRDLLQMHSGGVRLAPDQVVGLFLATAEAMAYLDTNQFKRAALHPGAIHLGDDGIPRLDNLAAAQEVAMLDRKAELQQTGQSLSVLLHRGMPESAAVDTFIKSLMHGGLTDWGQAATQARRLSRSLAKAEGSGSAASAAKGRGESSRKKGKPVVLLVTLLVCAAIVIGGYVALTGGGAAPVAKDFDAMVRIPAGSIAVNGKMEDVAEFSIDQYEVSIAQYAEFLAELSAMTGDLAKQFDHPDQPAAKAEGHEPKEWAGIFRAAKRGGKFQGHPVSLNHPIVAVDWWDAFAYAKWKGRRLPSAAEWHLAALGPDPEFRFPWGKRDEPTLYNSGADFDQNGEGGSVDGFNFWAPVDAFPNDRSPRGVYGLAGNVSEWVDTWEPHPEFPDQRVPVVMGASFATKAANITERRPAKTADAAQLAVGFRTAQ